MLLPSREGEKLTALRVDSHLLVANTQASAQQVTTRIAAVRGDTLVSIGELTLTDQSVGP